MVASVDQVEGWLEGLGGSVWATIAGHGRAIDIYSPDIQDFLDVTDERLRNLYDAFDRDFDGRLSKPELLQGLAQQGFPSLAGTRAFELLWETCEKISEGPTSSTKNKDENCITFAAFKRIVQRLKMELLFLPELHSMEENYPDSRCCTPVHMVGEGGRNGFTSPDKPLISVGNDPPILPSGLVGPIVPSLSINFAQNVNGQPQYGTMVDGRGEPVKFSSVDYNQKRYHAEIPVTDTYSFFTIAHRDPKDFTMRWLHLEGLDRLTILRFAVKYSIHPLSVEDALKLEDQQPKVNKYGSHYFIVFPFFRLTHESRKALDSFRQRRRASSKGPGAAAMDAAIYAASPPSSSSSNGKKSNKGLIDFQFRVEWSKLCLFVAGPPSYDTIISLHGKWEIFNIETDELSSVHAPGQGTYKPDLHTPRGSGDKRGGTEDGSSGGLGVAKAVDVTPNHSVNCPSERDVQAKNKHIFEPLVRALKVDYSVLRQGNSKHLMYKILDEVVDHLLPIVRAYRTRVRLFKTMLHTNETKFGKEEMLLVLGIKSELQRLQRRIRPMTAVVRHLMDDAQIGHEMKVYLEDVLDHIVRSLEEIGGCIEMCDSTKEEYKSSWDQRTNDVLYTLTIVTTLFVPLQFLSSVYGMNFVSPDGTPTMPELKWRHGYAFFWSLSGILFLGLLYFFRMYKKWI